MGALVGLSLAAGRTDVLAEVALTLDWRMVSRLLFEPRWPRGGLVDGRKVTAFIRRQIQDRRIEELEIPYAAVATDLLSGGEVVIRGGSAIEAIRASIAVPGLFTPVEREGRLLVDGGFVNPVPVDVARGLGAEVVLAVDVSHYAPAERATEAFALRRGSRERRSGTPSFGKRSEAVRRLEGVLRQAGERMRRLADRTPWLAEFNRNRRPSPPGLWNVLGMALRIAESQIAEMRYRLNPPDLILRPPVGGYFFMDFGCARAIEQAGYEAARGRMKELRTLLGLQ